MQGDQATARCQAYSAVLEHICARLRPSAADAGLPDLAAFAARYLAHAPRARFVSATDPQFDRLTRRDVEALSLAATTLAPEERDALQLTHREITQLLRQVPMRLGIESVTPAQFDRVLGALSPARRLWKLLAEQLSGGAERRARVASILLHGKRPALLPFVDRRLRAALGVPASQVWEAMWCLLRDPVLQGLLRVAQQQASEARELSLLEYFAITLLAPSEIPSSETPA